MKKLLIAGLLMVGLPAGAMTGPLDSVGVFSYDGELASQQKYYYKQWKDLTLDAPTRNALNQKTQQLERDMGANLEKFKVHYLYIGEGKLTGAFFLGNYGDVVMMDWPGGKVCSLSFTGNGGYAGVGDQACH